MIDETLNYGVLLISSIASAFLWFMYAVTGNFRMFKVHPLERISQRFFGNYGLGGRSLVTLYLLVVVFIISVATVLKMQTAGNPYLVAVLGSFIIFLVMYPITCSLILREHFWFRDISLFWFLLITHFIYWWILVVFYVITIKWAT